MKVFLSWSGDRSHEIAKALHGWLPLTLQAIQPWLSSSDVEAGTRWSSELEFQLQQTRFGIICLTPENLNARWLYYEAGALSKSLESAYVCPYLFGFSPTELTGPLVQFQAVTADERGTLALLKTLNRALGENSLNDSALEQTFLMWWPILAKEFSRIATDLSGSSVKNLAHKRVELLDRLARDEEALLDRLLQRLSAPMPDQDSEPESRPKEYVFIVHGRDLAAKETVARVIERLGLAAIVFHEQPNEGKTIIEKLESLAAVSYAVVLMTADDIGALGTEPTQNLQARARQNVIFELGYLTARLGRSRICVLVTEGVEIPSDFSGVLYILMDEPGAWRFLLAREFRRAGLSVDINQLL
jgi:predicted nucleotide-binding protein